MSSLTSADIQALLAEVAGRAGRYLASLDERPVSPQGTAVAGLARFDEPLPELPGDAVTTLALLDEAGSPATMTNAAALTAARDHQLRAGPATTSTWPLATVKEMAWGSSRAVGTHDDDRPLGDARRRRP